MKKLLVVAITLLVAGAALLAFGLAFMSTEAMCAGQPMPQNGVCQDVDRTTQKVTKERTYEQVKATAANLRLIVSGTGGVLAVLGAVGLVLSLRKQPSPTGAPMAPPHGGGSQFTSPGVGSQFGPGNAFGPGAYPPQGPYPQAGPYPPQGNYPGQHQQAADNTHLAPGQASWPPRPN